MKLLASLGLWVKRWRVRRFVHSTLDGNEASNFELIRLVSWLWRVAQETEERYAKRDDSRSMLHRGRWYIGLDATEQAVVCDTVDGFWRLAERAFDEGGWDAEADIERLKLLVRSSGDTVQVLEYGVRMMDRAYLVPRQLAKVRLDAVQVLNDGALEFWPSQDWCVEITDLSLSSLERGLTALAAQSGQDVADFVVNAERVILTLPEDDVRERETWLAFLVKRDFFELERPLDERTGLVGYAYILGKCVAVHSARAVSGVDRSKVRLALILARKDYIKTVFEKSA